MCETRHGVQLPHVTSLLSGIKGPFRSCVHISHLDEVSARPNCGCEVSPHLRNQGGEGAPGLPAVFLLPHVTGDLAAGMGSDPPQAPASFTSTGPRGPRGPRGETVLCVGLIPGRLRFVPRPCFIPGPRANRSQVPVHRPFSPGLP